MPTPDYRKLAQIAFEHYSDYTGWKTYNGKPIPPFEEIGEPIQRAWESAARGVVEQLRPEVTLDVREHAAVRFCRDYATNHAAAAVPGHSLIMLVAKLAQAIGIR